MKKKEVDCDPNAVRVHHLVEFLRGEKVVDSSCTNGDLLCFALHMIMIDSGYQPINVSSYSPPSPLSRTPPGDAHEQHWGRNPLLSSSHSHHANVKSSWNSSQAVTVSKILLRQL